jgi:hypothetical protein
MGSPDEKVILTFKGTILNLFKYEYHKSTDTCVYNSKTALPVSIHFSIDMQLGMVYEPVPPSEFLVLDEPTPVYTEMNWKDLNLSIADGSGTHCLHYSEAHTEGYGTETYHAHQVEFGNEYSLWFLDQAWGNANDRYDLLYEYLNRPDLFTYEEKAHTTLNWNPKTAAPNLIRIGEMATGTLTLIDIHRSDQRIVTTNPESPAHLDMIAVGATPRSLSEKGPRFSQKG